MFDYEIVCVIIIVLIVCVGYACFFNTTHQKVSTSQHTKTNLRADRDKDIMFNCKNGVCENCSEQCQYDSLQTCNKCCGNRQTPADTDECLSAMGLDLPDM